MADFIISHNATFENQLIQYQKALMSFSERLYRSAWQDIDYLRQRLNNGTRRIFEIENFALQKLQLGVSSKTVLLLQREFFSLGTLKQKLGAFDVQKTLARGSHSRIPMVFCSLLLKKLNPILF